MAQQQTIQQYFRSLTILHYALVMGQVMFAVVAYVLQSNNVFGNDELPGNVFGYVLPLFAVACVVISSVLYKKQVNNIKTKNKLAEKLNAYRGAIIARDALLELPALLSIIAYLLTGELLFLALAGSLIAIFLFVRPGKEKMVKDLELSTEEIMIITDGSRVIDR